MKKRFWKTLIRIEDIDKENGHIFVVIPGWNPNKTIRLSWDNIPQIIKNMVEAENKKHFYVEVNIGAESKEELHFRNWT